MGYLRVGYDTQVNIEKIFKGSLVVLDAIEPTKKLMTWAEACLTEEFGDNLNLSNNDSASLGDFISKAQAAKTKFTNHENTRQILEELLIVRYANYLDQSLYYDVPRLRIIPNSDLLRSGIAYNYLPHRDTWYGGRQDQVNHWLSVKNVSDQSTFFIAPTYFSMKVENSSGIFDLETWDKKYRPLATESVDTERRPHPKTLVDISDDHRIALDLASGCEICFSGHHLHGSNQNKSNDVRVSIDYRVSVPSISLEAPKNVDGLATGNYLEFMIKHPNFAVL